MAVRGSTQNRAADNAIKPGKKQRRCNRPVLGARIAGAETQAVSGARA
jgi:hypothetical protein